MGFRETLNQSKVAPIALVAVVIVALAIIIWQMRGPSYGPGAIGKVFYTVDDGKTWFEDTADKIPPFDHDGKEAVRAHVFVPAKGGAPFVGYLERYTKEAKEALEKEKANPGAEAPMMGPQTVEVKRPGEGRPWVREGDIRFDKVIEVKAPDGSADIKSFNPGDKQ